MKYVLSIILLLVIFVCTILLRNQAHLFESPGLGKRLLVYLTENVAQTSTEPVFPELRPEVYPVSANTLYRELRFAISSLGWSLEDGPAADHPQQKPCLHAVVTSSLLGFEDDVVIIVQELACEYQQALSYLKVRSSSRIGKADFAANAGHIQSLFAQLKRQLDAQSITALSATRCRAEAAPKPPDL